jgi:hypothetical protein
MILRLKSALIAALVLTFFASNAFADKIVLTGHTDYRDGSGGEFNITAADASGKAILDSLISNGYTTVNGTTLGTADGTRMNVGFGGFVGFETFCLEYNETISLGSTYNFKLDIGAINGGVAGAVDPDGNGPLPKMDRVSLGTAYLYTLFATGALAPYGYDYPDGDERARDAEKLQKAIWFLEDERTLAEIGANSYVTLVTTKFGSTAAAKADNNFYNVGVINLWNDSGHLKQSQLIMRVPDGGVTSLMLGLALTALAGLRRRSN